MQTVTQQGSGKVGLAVRSPVPQSATLHTPDHCPEFMS